MTQRRQSLGREGERQAARYLEARGYRIVARNVRAARVEIDLIARRGPLLSFVEVKSRRACGPSGFGSHSAAAEAVDPRKQARLRRGAQAWLAEHPQERRRARRVRFDVVTCVLLAPSLNHASPTIPASISKNDNTASPEETRWSIEHWQAAF